MYSGIYSGILSDIYSGILSDIYSDILSGILSDILCSGGSGQEGDKREVEGRSEIPALVQALSYNATSPIARLTALFYLKGNLV